MVLDAGHRTRGDVGRRADLQHDAGRPPGAPAARGPGRPRRRGRSARRRAGAATPRSCSGPVVSPACGTERRPAARAASKCGWNCARGTPISGPPSPKPTSASVRWSSAYASVASAAGSPALAGDVVDPAQHQPEVALGGDPGVLDGLGVGLDRDAAGDRGVRRAGQLGVAQVLPVGHLAGHLVGQQPDVLGRADQVDDGEVDLDEVREVAERRRSCRSVVGVGRHARRRVAHGELGDDPWRGRPDVVHVELGLGQAGDEVGEAHAAQSLSGGQPTDADQRRCRRSRPGPRPATSSPSTKTDRGGVDAGLRGRLVGCVDPALEGHVLDAGTYVGLLRSGLDGQGRPGRRRRGRVRTRTAGRRRAGRGTPWRPRDPTSSSTTANALADSGE